MVGIDDRDVGECVYRDELVLPLSGVKQDESVVGEMDIGADGVGQEGEAVDGDGAGEGVGELDGDGEMEVGSDLELRIE